MDEGTARARREVAGMRSASVEHIAKWRAYPEPHDKATALKTIERVQGEIAKIQAKHPSLKNDYSALDTWRP